MLKLSNNVSVWALRLGVIGFGVVMIGITVVTGQAVERVIGMAGMAVLLALYLLVEASRKTDTIMVVVAGVVAAAYSYDALTRGQTFKLVFYSSALAAILVYAAYGFVSRRLKTRANTAFADSPAAAGELEAEEA